MLGSVLRAGPARRLALAGGNGLRVRGARALLPARAQTWARRPCLALRDDCGRLAVWRSLSTTTDDQGEAAKGAAGAAVDGEATGEAGEEATKENQEEEEEEEEEEVELTEQQQIALQHKARRLVKAKLTEESERYNAEMEQYNKEMSALRSKWLAEHSAGQVESQIERKERILAARTKEEKRLRWVDHMLNKHKHNKTALEVDPLDAWQEQQKLDLEERRRQREARREFALGQVEVRGAEERRKAEVRVRALAMEARHWLTQKDLDDGTLDAKIRKKLSVVQPITAAFSNELPLRHHESAVNYITDDSMWHYDDEFWQAFDRGEVEI